MACVLQRRGGISECGAEEDGLVGLCCVARCVAWSRGGGGPGPEVGAGTAGRRGGGRAGIGRQARVAVTVARVARRRRERAVGAAVPHPSPTQSQANQNQPLQPTRLSNQPAQKTSPINPPSHHPSLQSAAAHPPLSTYLMPASSTRHSPTRSGQLLTQAHPIRVYMQPYAGHGSVGAGVAAGARGKADEGCCGRRGVLRG